MKMAKYRIRVEALDANEKLDEELINGIECEGYFMVAHKDGGNDLSIQDMSEVDIAIAIAKSTELLSAAIIAKAMEEGRRMKREREKPKEVKVDLTRLFRKMAGED
jgi:hypothetical protein